MRKLKDVDIKKLVIQGEHAKVHKPLRPEEYIDLLSSIRRMGILVPIIAEAREGGSLQVLAGHYRIRAARECGQTVVHEVHVVETAHEKVAALLDNATRRQLTPSEAARDAL